MNAANEAVTKLENLRQGHNKVLLYNSQFRALAAATERFEFPGD